MVLLLFLILSGMFLNMETPDDRLSDLQMTLRAEIMERKKIEIEEMFERLRREETLTKMAVQSLQKQPAQLYEWVIYVAIIVACIPLLVATVRMLLKSISGQVFIFCVKIFFIMYIIPFVIDQLNPVAEAIDDAYPLEADVGPVLTLTTDWMFQYYITYFIQGLHMLVEHPFLKMAILFVPLFMFSYLMAYGLKTLVVTYVKHGVYHTVGAPQLLLALALWLGLHYIVCIMLQKLPRGNRSNKLTIVVLLLEFAAFYWMNALD